MKLRKVLLCCAVLLACCGIGRAVYIAESGVKISWGRTLMDGHRTGVQSVTVDNQAEALGVFDGETYVSPSGNRFTEGATPAVAAALIEVQPKMARLKEVIGYSAVEMEAYPPESPLSNLFVDELRAAGSRIFGREADLALANFGGIRTSMPEGPVVLDDILSMFPFRNVVVMTTVRGRSIKTLFDQLAETGSFQCISGARVVIKDRKVVSAEIGGEPIEDDRLYNFVTIDFLLTGGDRIAIGAIAESLEMSDVLLKDIMLDYVRRLNAEGKKIEYQTDGRVVIEN